MIRFVPFAFAVALFFVAAPAFAAEPEPQSFWRQLLVMWFPMILFIGLFYGILRWAGVKKQRALLDRSGSHMDAVEQKLDRIIELLEERRDR